MNHRQATRHPTAVLTGYLGWVHLGPVQLAPAGYHTKEFEHYVMHDR